MFSRSSIEVFNKPNWVCISLLERFAVFDPIASVHEDSIGIKYFVVASYKRVLVENSAEEV